MEKEIEILDFVLKEQARRKIETGMINSDQGKLDEYDALTKMELARRKNNNQDRSIFNEQRILKDEERNRKQEKRDAEVKKQRKIIIYVSTITVLALGTFSLKKYSDYINQPVKVAVREMASDVGLYSTTDVDHVDGTMTDEELLEFIKKNNLNREQILKEIDNFSRKQDIDKEFFNEKIQAENSEIFKTY